jgi:precorrin-3B synthase
MTMMVPPMVRGECPGALRPMESGDGLIVRVRPRTGRLELAALRGIASAAHSYGNGSIDLTRRANLQIRGVTETGLGALQRALDDIGLLDRTPEGEGVRNIVLSPLAGCDPSEYLDVRPLARQLEAALTCDEHLWCLPAKFGFVLDGGGALALDDARGDIRLTALQGGTHVAVGLDAASGVSWLGAVAAGEAIPAAVELAATFVARQPRGSRARMREASPETRAALEAARDFGALPQDIKMRRDAEQRVGVIAFEDTPIAVGLAVPFGRLDADMLEALGRICAIAGAQALRLSPWRTVYIPVDDSNSCAAILTAAESAGLIVQPGDPRLGIEACPGVPGCRSAQLDTRAAALKIAALKDKLADIGSVHVSGCTKGCAYSSVRDLVLVGHDHRFAVIERGRANGVASFLIDADELERLPEMLVQPNGGRAHG